MTYSTDLRQLALAKHAQGLSIRKVSAQLGISVSTLKNWKKNPVPKGYPAERKPRKISRTALIEDVANYPDAYQSERAQRFGCSPTAIGKALKKYKISQKKDQ
ncbi:MAG: IS630 transposase-related protein [Neisseria sp.]|nr:IS630 transposase-related protein [Neisseria sp.]